MKKWIVLYTRSRWEKKVDKLLSDQNITCFCPLVKRNRKWIDRNKVVEMPLFNSYLFINATPLELTKAVQTTGVISYVSHCGKPAIISDVEIDHIRTTIKAYSDVDTVPLSDINVGDYVKVKNGLFVDHLGKILEIQGKSVVMIIEKLNCALTVKIDHQQLLHA
jgi:transcription antitermination factor NusG